MTETKSLRIYLIRHGETEWSLSGQHTGSTDIALTAHGEDQARALRPWLADLSFAHIFVSPRQRARRTAELAGLAGALEVEPDLAEWDYGVYEGRKSSEIHTERPGWTVFKDGCPGGETPQQVTDRADRLIAKLRTFQGNVALVSHGHFSCALAVRWIGLAMINGQHFSLSTASLSTLGYAPNHPDVPVISLWNGVPTAR